MWFQILFTLLILAGVIVGVVFLTKSSSGSKSFNKSNDKSLFKTCKNSFDCDTGFHCELRDHPSNGICVLPGGSACHAIKDDDACYSGYYCDKQDGVCLKSE